MEKNPVKIEQGKRLIAVREIVTPSSAMDFTRLKGIKYPTYGSHENGSRAMNLETATEYVKNIISLLPEGRGFTSDFDAGDIATWIMSGKLHGKEVAAEDIRSQLLGNLGKGVAPEMQAPRSIREVVFAEVAPKKTTSDLNPSVAMPDTVNNMTDAINVLKWCHRKKFLRYTDYDKRLNIVMRDTSEADLKKNKRSSSHFWARRK